MPASLAFSHIAYAKGILAQATLLFLLHGFTRTFQLRITIVGCVFLCANWKYKGSKAENPIKE